MVATVGAKLIEDAAFVETTATLIAAVDWEQTRPFAGQTRVRCLRNHELESTNR